MPEQVVSKFEQLKDVNEADVLAKLAASFSGENRCISHTFNWWTYELCFNDVIKQYRIEGNKIVGDGYVLGHYRDSVPPGDVRVAKSAPLYFAQNFTGGTVCDLTLSLRRAELRFYCNPELVDPTFDLSEIVEIDEPSSCTYVIHVHTGALCAFPAYVPIEADQPAHAIECAPLVNQTQFDRYKADVNERERQQLERERHKFDFTPVSPFDRQSRADRRRHYGAELSQYYAEFEGAVEPIDNDPVKTMTNAAAREADARRRASIMRNVRRYEHKHRTGVALVRALLYRFAVENATGAQVLNDQLYAEVSCMDCVSILHYRHFFA